MGEVTEDVIGVTDGVNAIAGDDDGAVPEDTGVGIHGEDDSIVELKGSKDGGRARRRRCHGGVDDGEVTGKWCSVALWPLWK